MIFFWPSEQETHVSVCRGPEEHHVCAARISSSISVKNALRYGLGNLHHTYSVLFLLVTISTVTQILTLPTLSPPPPLFIPPLLRTCLFCSVVFNLHFVLSSYVKYPNKKYKIHFERINFKNKLLKL